MYRFAEFELDPQRAELRGPDGAAVKLRRKTYEMLLLFAANSGRVVTKQELMDAVWPNVHVGEDSLFQCIRELRTALGDGERQLIKLVPGRGYLFDTEMATGAAEASPPAPIPDIGPPAVIPAAAAPHLRKPVAIALVAGFCAVVGMAIAAPLVAPNLFKSAHPVVIVLPVTSAGNGPHDATLAAAVSDRLVQGFSRIENIRLVAPRHEADAQGTLSGSSQSPLPPSSFIVRGELQRTPQGWTLQARMIRTETGEVETVATAQSGTDKADEKVRPSRLAAGVGHQLAQRLNRLLETPPATFTQGDAFNAKAAIDQAAASINQTTRERFGMAQTMLKNALESEPDNIDIAVALAALQMRGIQMIWYTPDEATAAEAQAAATLERALSLKPRSIAVLETYCRFQSATNRFVDSLVTCTRALDFDPWNGLSLFLIGLGQIHLGRFDDALATFLTADSYDTPVVSRWTWLLGVGWAYQCLGRYEESIPWMQRSIAITPASGRPNMMLAASYQALGRTAEAQAAIKQGLAIRPGTTAKNLPSPWTNASPLFIKRSNEVLQLMIAAGLPEG